MTTIPCHTLRRWFALPLAIGAGLVTMLCVVALFTIGPLIEHFGAAADAESQREMPLFWVALVVVFALGAWASVYFPWGVA